MSDIEKKNYTKQYSIGSAVWATITVILGIFLNRQRGLGEDRLPWLSKPVVYGIFTLFNMVTISFLIITQENFPWWTIPIVAGLLFGSYFLGFSPSWGECFPWAKPTYNEKFAPLVRQSANLLSGYKYDENTPVEKVISWKIDAMSARFGIYFSLKYIIFSIASSSPVSLLGIPLIFLVGRIYGISFKKKQENAVEMAEYATGGYMMLVDSLLLFTSYFLFFKI